MSYGVFGPLQQKIDDTLRTQFPMDRQVRARTLAQDIVQTGDPVDVGLWQLRAYRQNRNAIDAGLADMEVAMTQRADRFEIARVIVGVVVVTMMHLLVAPAAETAKAATI